MANHCCDIRDIQMSNGKRNVSSQRVLCKEYPREQRKQKQNQAEGDSEIA